MRADARGLYVHIPFCIKKCNYCDFCSFGGASREEILLYKQALIEEITEYTKKRIRIKTVYFGGGTPSILEPSDFSEIMLAIRQGFDVDKDAEITVEANPGTLTEEKLSVYRALGVNRISIGLQSANDDELRLLGRVHSFEDFLKAYRLARDAGIQSINVDIMYAIPSQTLESLGKTLDRVISLSPEHISAYGLIIEEGTPFFEKRTSLNFPGEDTECEMYEYITKRLRESGYTHYEISNYAKPGRESRHNLVYWQMGEYIGLGLNAHSYFENLRYSNTSVMEEYIGSERADYRVVEKRDASDFEREYIMLALRLARGIDEAEYRCKFGREFRRGREGAISRLLGLGLIEESGGRIRITERGFYLSNRVILEFL